MLSVATLLAESTQGDRVKTIGKMILGVVVIVAFLGLCAFFGSAPQVSLPIIGAGVVIAIVGWVVAPGGAIMVTGIAIAATVGVLWVIGSIFG